ncbi:hypothetical protein F2P81_023189 [Scophthalmus maximus]|uniref:Uncharacterized protein n=1 Tax=Scophthalmus maximus TaxID=52904 RepID=A0A6A4RVL7_SCOMX|nr:hypothetical protein F2P81_023189 [Scophthalmus maximus]
MRDAACYTRAARWREVPTNSSGRPPHLLFGPLHRLDVKVIARRVLTYKSKPTCRKDPSQKHTKYSEGVDGRIHN